MTREDRGGQEYDIFIANVIYPDAAAVFAWRPKPLEDVKNECLVVLDTNVLVVPYTISPKNLAQIGDTYRALVDQGRLVVPGQVAREFARLRVTKLAELQQKLLDQKSKAVRLQMGKYPLLESVEEYQATLELEGQVNDLLARYKEALEQVADRVRRWTWSDPVSLLYKELFDARVVLDPHFEQEEIEKDLAWRQKHKIPPGYKDASKDDKGVGDLLIWHTILKAGEDQKKSTVFVTGEEKADWWHKSSGGALYPRHELVEEYRTRSGDHSFHVVSFSNFLDLFGADKEVVEEVVRQEEAAFRAYPYFSGNSVYLEDGRILVVRHAGSYGAVKAIKQTSMERGASINYQWWYQPNGADTFTQTGYGHTWEVRNGNEPNPGKYHQPVLEIGPIELEWSVSGDGAGFVYFGPPRGHSEEYELALTNEPDISNVDVSRLSFLQRQVVDT